MWAMARAQEVSIGFVGAGHLARSLASGLVAGGLAAEHIWVTNRTGGEALDAFRRMGCSVTNDLEIVCRAADTLFLLFKPKDAESALRRLKPHIDDRQLVISCLAGVPLSYIESSLGPGRRVVRAMPNTSSTIRASATTVATGRWASPEDLQRASDLLEAVGEVWTIPEEWMDVATAVAGSGPAYVYVFLEAMVAAATELGLPAEIAWGLVTQTTAGAVQLARTSQETPAALRRQVSSPGGTTVAALEVLEKEHFSQILNRAICRATERSRELGQQWQ